MTNRIIQIEHLTKNYTNFQLDDINFFLSEGTIMGLIGPNGSGKTTIIRLILNMIKKNNGSIKIFGLDHIKSEIEIKEKIGIVFDSNYFANEWFMKDVEKNIGRFYENWNKSLYYSFLDRFNIDISKRVCELSKGMQMKLMLACAFSYDAKLLILDEPTSGLDPVSRDDLLDIMKEYVSDKKHSVLFSTHITTDLEKIANYITYINLGNMIYSGTKKEFINKYQILSGNISQLNEEIKEKAISIHRLPESFEALVIKGNIKTNHNYDIRSATIEEIMVFNSKRREL